MMNIGFPLLEQNAKKGQISVKQPQEIDQSWNYTHSKMWFCPKWEKYNKYWATNIKCMISSNPIYSQQTSSTNGNLTSGDLSLAHHGGLLINMILQIKKKKINIFHGHWGVYFLRLPLLSIPTLFYPTAPCFQTALLG